MLQSANQEMAKLRLTTLLDLTQNEATGPKVLLRIQNKTADYTVLQSDSGTVFTNSGDTGAIIYTLPTSITKGWFAVFVNMVDQDMTITNGTVDKLIAYNDLAADSVAFSTASHQIGQAILVISNGTSFVGLALTSGTLTVGT